MRVISFSYLRRADRPPPEATKIIDCRALRKPGVPAAVLQALLREARQHAANHPAPVIAFGCDFGRERSVHAAERFAREYGVTVEHTAKRVFQESL